MKTLKEFWNHSFQRANIKPNYDSWLDKYANEFKETNIRILDIGRGIGNNSLYLKGRGYHPIACDISEEAIRKLKESIPDCDTRCFDMRESFPFDKQSIDVIIADLSLHYFDEVIHRF